MPTGDTGNDGIMGVDETWTYTYVRAVTQDMIKQLAVWRRQTLDNDCHGQLRRWVNPDEAADEVSDDASVDVYDDPAIDIGMSRPTSAALSRTRMILDGPWRKAPAARSTSRSC